MVSTPTGRRRATCLMSGAAVTCEGEKLFMTKFNLSSIHHQEKPRPRVPPLFWPGPVAVPEKAPAPTESMLRSAPAGGEEGLRFTYQSLSKATNNLEKRLGDGGCESVFEVVMTVGTRLDVNRLELGVVSGASGLSKSTLTVCMISQTDESSWIAKNALKWWSSSLS